MSDSANFKTVIKVTVVNSTINTLLALFKIIIGTIGHSQALIADGLHSFADLVTDALVLIAAKLGNKSPDWNHPYGHQRIETIASIIISIILIGVAFGIAYENIQHLILGAHTGKPSMAVVFVAFGSILANEFLYRYTLKSAKAIKSELLRINAWHNRTDALVSVIVLISVVGAIFGVPYLDAIGALIIALLIFKIGAKMTWDGLKELIDTGVDSETLSKIQQTISQTDGVHSLHQLRSRSHGGKFFVDAHIQVDPNLSVSEGHYIAEQVHIKLISSITDLVDVTVHIDPENDETWMLSKNLPSRPDILTLLNKHWQELAHYKQIQRTVLHYLSGNVYVEIYIPLDAIGEQSAAEIQSSYNEAVKAINYIKQVSVFFSSESR